jgi:DNA repair exonuclease SbcCD ATPase subunit
MVRRGIKPNVFEIYQDGVLINLDADVDDYQAVLDKQILKINHKSFSQIVVLGSASFVPFMQLTAAARREVIEDLLDIQIFSVMNTLLKEKASKNKQECTDTDYQINLVDNKIELEEKHLIVLEQTNDDAVKQKTEQLAGYLKQVADIERATDLLHTEVADLSQSIADSEKVSRKAEKVRTLMRQIEARAEKVRKEAEFFTSHHNCPTCRQGIADEHKTVIVEEANTSLVEIEAGQKKLTEELDRLNERLTEINTVKTAMSSKMSSVAQNKAKADTLTKIINDGTAEIEKMKQSVDLKPNKAKIQQLKEDLTALRSKRSALTVDRTVLDAAAVMLKDSGIKTKIIRQYVPIINKLINKYLAAMDFFVNFELDENFEEKIKSRFRDEFSYASFSEGEKSRLDLALLFTWRSISRLRNNASTNLLILDEVFDGSLDAQGNEELLKIIKTLTEGNNIFVITHKTDAYIDKFDRTLKFEKQKNFSTMVTL